MATVMDAGNMHAIFPIKRVLFQACRTSDFAFPGKENRLCPSTRFMPHGL